MLKQQTMTKEQILEKNNNVKIFDHFYDGKQNITVERALKAMEEYAKQEVAKEREKAKKLVHALRMCIGALKGLDATDYVAYTAGKVALIDYQNEIEPETTGNQTAC